MTTSSLLLLLASTITSGDVTTIDAFDRALSEPAGTVVRAQSPEAPTQVATQVPLEVPATGTETYYYPPAGTTAAPGGDPFAQQMSPGFPQPITQDPWLGGNMAPYAAPAGPQQSYYQFGVNGPQPFKFGWTARYDLTYYFEETVRGPLGNYEQDAFAFDLEKEYTAPLGGNWVYSIAPQFNFRTGLGGTSSGTSTGDDRQFYRFGLGMNLHSPTVAGWTYEFGFNPSMGTDFDQNINNNAVMYDAHAVAYWQVAPQWMWAFGVAYWDRVDDIILPYAGAVINPNPYLELRLLFPKPRISWFLGTPWGLPTWVYAEGEYHVEAYQAGTYANPLMVGPQGGNSTRVQYRDWRVVGGIRWEAGWWSMFVEGGWVFNRDIEFKNYYGKLDVDDGAIIRAGLRY